MRLLANALSRIRNGSSETSRPAPNRMISLEKSRAFSSLTKLCGSDPSYQARAAAQALRSAGVDGVVTRSAAS